MHGEICYFIGSLFASRTLIEQLSVVEVFCTQTIPGYKLTIATREYTWFKFIRKENSIGNAPLYKAFNSYAIFYFDNTNGENIQISSLYDQLDFF